MVYHLSVHVHQWVSCFHHYYLTRDNFFLVLWLQVEMVVGLTIVAQESQVSHRIPRGRVEYYVLVAQAVADHVLQSGHDSEDLVD